MIVSADAQKSSLQARVIECEIASAPPLNILRFMRRERLKDQIEDPRVSVFDTFVRAVVILISLGAVYYSFSGRGYPSAAKGGPGPAGSAGAGTVSQVTLTATHHRAFYWNTEGPIPITDASARLAAWLKITSAPQVVIAADEAATFGDMVRLLEEARRLGVTDVRIQTRPRSTP